MSENKIDKLRQLHAEDAAFWRNYDAMKGAAVDGIGEINGRGIKAMKTVKESDGSTTLYVQWVDGGATKFIGVMMTGFKVDGVAMAPIEMKFFGSGPWTMEPLTAGSTPRRES